MFAGRRSFKSEGVNRLADQMRQCSVYQAMTRNAGQTREFGRDDHYAEVAVAGAGRTAMASMKVTFIDDFQMRRVQRRCQRALDRGFNARLRHGLGCHGL